MGSNRTFTVARYNSLSVQCKIPRSDPIILHIQIFFSHILLLATVYTERPSLMALRIGESEGIIPENPATPFRRAGKEVMDGSEVQKKAILINMSDARKAMHPRFFAVGLFLSVLLVNSRQLIEHMKKVWRVRGEVEANDLQADEGRKFILEFSEEGDMRHVVREGPWQYKGDAFLVEMLHPGADPAAVSFTHVPMWVQFREIPFYLLTKKLARRLAEEVGDLIMIDNKSRGSIFNKFLRAHVNLPLYMALQKTMKLEDEITGEEVQVQLRYERLPNFCLFCGFIGHMEARCDLHPTARRIDFSQDLRVPAVHFDDPRAWYLAEDMGRPRNRAGAEVFGPWRVAAPSAPSSSQNTDVARVADDVAKLSVNSDNIVISDKPAPATTAATSSITTVIAVETDMVLGDTEASAGGGVMNAMDKTPDPAGEV